jgi:hypothetical protein
MPRPVTPGGASVFCGPKMQPRAWGRLVGLCELPLNVGHYLCGAPLHSCVGAERQTSSRPRSTRRASRAAKLRMRRSPRHWRYSHRKPSRQARSMRATAPSCQAEWAAVHSREVTRVPQLVACNGLQDGSSRDRPAENARKRPTAPSQFEANGARLDVGSAMRHDLRVTWPPPTLDTRAKRRAKWLGVAGRRSF